jgi:hypothetical protein
MDFKPPVDPLMHIRATKRRSAINIIPIADCGIRLPIRSYTQQVTVYPEPRPNEFKSG